LKTTWNLATQYAVFYLAKSILYASIIKNIYKVWKHSNLLPLIAENRPLDCMLECRYIGFYKTISESKNNIVKYIAHTRLYDYTSTMSRNMLHITSKYNLSIDDIRSLSKTNINRHCYNKWLTVVDNDYPIYAGIIKEMLMMKEERCIRTLSNDDCNFVIKFLCTI